ncbi:MAG: hypothetical protein Q8927_19005 [Bacteroidota bacterium]|nr:hypothetical protein [Bacteroidota bacterium]MDP4218296.1 hypothetical protein [Bacteroidota bacterium]MDP4245260.1 hypothetical protein [Bacteroidota bacterium]MDP4254806.1 hypothetical protein [Bacteroidota bacterium]MDP4259427.1 hypothetical protein [Bacteroidota bacterium]
MRVLFPSLCGILLIQITCSTTCQKNGPGSQRAVNPFQQWLTNTGDTASVTVHPNDLPVEIGYTFTSSAGGSVVQLGIRLPDTGRTYAVTLWDGVSKASLVQKNIKVATMGFNYVSLVATNEAVAIQANHSYVISVLMIPQGLVGAGPAGDDFFDVERTDRKDIFPMTIGPITYQHQYSKPSGSASPVFPDNLTSYQNFINGICDIGFSSN